MALKAQAADAVGSGGWRYGCGCALLIVSSIRWRSVGVCCAMVAEAQVGG
jgi:hypothetical protein